MNKPSREIVLPDDQAALLLRERSRRGFLVAGLAGAAGIAGYEALIRAGKEDSLPWTERRVLEVNRKLSQAYLSDSRLTPTYSASGVEPLKPNGDIGLDPDFEISKWRLAVTSDNAAPGLELALADITALPKVEMITRFCCIEGWTRITHWAGTRFLDFTKKFFPPGLQLPKYVYLTTPDEEYYVGLDMKSAMHPQTLLAYELNGKPLEAVHGAPLRLVIPVKYGIKNIKRIGSIKYTDKKPDDYWGEQGYDWFAGL